MKIYSRGYKRMIKLKLKGNKKRDKKQKNKRGLKTKKNKRGWHKISMDQVSRAPNKTLNQRKKTSITQD